MGSENRRDKGIERGERALFKETAKKKHIHIIR